LKPKFVSKKDRLTKTNLNKQRKGIKATEE
jgi:hypothetical protein